MSEVPHTGVERVGNMLIVTMNRPDAENALSSEIPPDAPSEGPIVFAEPWTPRFEGR